MVHVRLFAILLLTPMACLGSFCTQHTSAADSESVDSDQITECLDAVAEALMEHDRPFVPQDLSLSTVIDVEFDSPTLDFNTCCNEYHYNAETFDIDPLSDELTNAALARTGTSQEFTFIPELEPEVYYSLISVDPDVPFALFGTEEEPLLHMLHVDVTSGDEGTVVLPYAGPKPPDQLPHTYYFFLYEQPQAFGDFPADNLGEYTSDECAYQNKCRFQMNQFVADHSLSLLGASWYVSENNAYVNFTRNPTGEDDEQYCPWTSSYPCSSTVNIYPHFLTFLGIFGAFSYIF